MLKIGKIAGVVDRIPLEIWKYGCPALNTKLQELFARRWEQGKLSQDLCNTVFISQNKNKWTPRVV